MYFAIFKRTINSGLSRKIVNIETPEKYCSILCAGKNTASVFVRGIADKPSRRAEEK